MLFPFLRPALPEPESWTPYLTTSYDQRYFSNFGPLATDLADRMSKAYLTEDYRGLLCASATAGLVAVLQALDVYGKKVALPDFTFAATVQAVFAAGATPVICDIDPDRWELCPNSLESAFAEHPDIACVIHVRPFGLRRDISAQKAVCRAHGVPLIVDAAAGLGAPNSGHPFGSEDGEIEVFSLHATKVFAIGEGGLIAAPRAMIGAIKAAMNFGFQADRTYGEGQNAKVDEFRAAIGLAMLERMTAITETRSRHAAFYDTVFAGLDGFQTAQDPGPTPWSNYPVVFDEEVTKETLGAFADNGIEIKKYYWPGVLKGYTGPRPVLSVPTPVSFSLQDRCACFPVYSDFTAETGLMIQERIERTLDLLARTRP
ncbi:DegT/DnrJ/EryC1/StrS family aminotransferase [Pacificoceanicola onchidii]|uniref:DegT/DnrJ/EryC1/StrS family aminotransferase n=1 Tax=Pacificoceanicola onchidii TaxID=2562685 RepID=UPI0010A62C0C|nr:DegT/DnrJ/EryC1/StrS family aminotransferase [Pacificoceanicola onchidii]